VSSARLSALAAAPLAAIAIACGVDSYVYTGRFYVEGRDCLATESSIEVVAGDPAPENCTPTCLVQQTTPDRETRVYVSTTCPPHPYGFDTSGADPRCARALAAFARSDTCLLDGGSSSPAPAPAPPSDAGGDAGAD
jgi:hypothetical protein